VTINDQFLTLREVAEYVDLHERTMYNPRAFSPFVVLAPTHPSPRTNGEDRVLFTFK